jgi:hypothetical protein
MPQPDDEEQQLSASAAALNAALGQNGPQPKFILDQVMAAFTTACPATAGTVQSRAVLAALLQELAEADQITLPKARTAWDPGSPPLPRWIRLPVPEREPPTRPTPPIWRKELHWATTAELGAAQIETLRAVNTWLRDTDDGSDTSIVPMRERSWEIFGDEKRLDRLLPTILFAPGRLTLGLLRAKRVPPPLALRRIGDGRTVLVIENSDTYQTLGDLLVEDPGPIRWLAYGAGHGFTASVARLIDLQDVNAIAYYGDLDTDGLQIPLRAHAVATALGLPPITPASGLYRLLLGQRASAGLDAPDIFEVERLVAWLPEDLHADAAAVIGGGKRIAQESTGVRLLRTDSSWRSGPLMFK